MPARPVARLRARVGAARRKRDAERLLASFASVGRDCVVYPDGTFLGPERIRIGSDVQIGPGAWFSAVEADIMLGNKVTVGPRLAVITGDHNSGEIGTFLHDVTAKRAGDDLPVVLEDDCWVGYGVVILKGVTVGRGAIIGAGAVVTRDVPAYGVCVGNPGRVVKYRWDRSTAERHERMLYGAVVSDLSHLEDGA
jgi:acetyltransferase-like isoleucine patch superfamily enzyme